MTSREGSRGSAPAPRPGGATTDTWWKDAVIYCADVQTFQDSDGDGQGDLPGMTRRLDHLHDLGVTCLWLLPLAPTADRDDGYDVTALFGVDPRLGTVSDLRDLTRAAAARGIRVVLDLVINHTSVDHPWFVQARRDPASRYRDFYVWRDEPAPEDPGDLVVPGVESSVWEYDDVAGAYYLHHFYRHQADLNLGNPLVRNEIASAMVRWLRCGVAGFRIDSVPFLFAKGADGAGTDPRPYLRQLRELALRVRPDAMLLGEVNLDYPTMRTYFGGSSGDALTMQFDFGLMQATYLALARSDAGPLERALGERLSLGPMNQFATFLRSHDELTIDRLTPQEQDEVFAKFAPDPRMRIYGRGVRRRLAPLLDGDPARLRLAYSLLMSMPGALVLYYGDEIGMGDDLSLPDRMPVRTPMQWAPGPNGGFSTAEAEHLARPVVTGTYGPDYVNVLMQQQDPSSLLSDVRRLIRLRRSSHEVGWGDPVIVEHDAESVLAHALVHGRAWTLFVHHFGDEDTLVDIPVPPRLGAQDVLVDALTGERHRVHDGRLALALAPYGRLWLREVDRELA
ncbi:hypothetical protein VV01_18565 [Luteipulveratus halotolerans]|uniref:Glycosyl hydrolase family 13 catalytic domain-containing protein n=1 Tax=Luteipulveratus halotolerans TaxID=1631356 RepID=A0A0L6CPL4_9MICO|nr:hypothetical protein VV01_18565 [Luteipulveratus halotolerans]